MGRTRPDTLRSWKSRHPDRVAALQRAYRHRHPEAVLARELVRQAVRRGELAVPAECENCGTVPADDPRGRRRIEGHHEDHLRPLDVQWLCRGCHIERHREAAA